MSTALRTMLGNDPVFTQYAVAVVAALTMAAAMLGMVVCVRRRAVPLTCLLVTAVLLPINSGGATGTSVSSYLLLAAVVSALWLTRTALGAVVVDQSRLSVAVIVLMCVVQLAFIVGQYPWFQTVSAPARAQVGGLAVFLVSGGVCLAMGHELRTVGELRRLTWWFLFAGAIVVVLQAAPMFDRIAQRVVRPESIGSLFWTWFVAMALGQALLNRALARSVRIGLLASTLVALGVGLLKTPSWASGWAPPVVAAGTVLLFRAPRVAAGLAVLAVPVVLALHQALTDTVMESESYSWTTRLEAWRTLVEMARRNPLLGLGPANYYFYASQFSVMGWHVAFSSHNTYMDLVLQTGLAGLAVFVWIVVEIYRVAFRLLPLLAHGFGRAYVAAVVGGTTGTVVAGMLGDWVLPFVYNVGLRGLRSSLLFWLFVGGLLALKRLLAAERRESDESGAMGLRLAARGAA